MAGIPYKDEMNVFEPHKVFRFINAAICIALLLPAAACNREINRRLVDAAAEGNALSAKALIEQGANVEALENDGWTPLTSAAREGHLEVVKLLLEKGANVNKLEGGGHTALFWASRNQHQQVIELLLSKGGKDI